MSSDNIDIKTVEGFGSEWKKYDQKSLPEKELAEQYQNYFDIFPWEKLQANAVGFDMGCGSGRWAKCVSSEDAVSKLFCIDASSKALSVAKENLKGRSNTQCLLGQFDNIPLEDESMDFGYCLGVLHHIPDPKKGLEQCVRKLKRGAPFLVYLYYAFDQRPWWFKGLWRASDWLRKSISKLPFLLRNFICQCLAILVYFPLSRMAFFLEKAGCDVQNFPLSAYRNKSFYTMKTDSLDRFGTRLEYRFTKNQIEQMMIETGLENISFSNKEPYWCAVGYKIT